VRFIPSLARTVNRRRAAFHRGLVSDWHAIPYIEQRLDKRRPYIV